MILTDTIQDIRVERPKLFSGRLSQDQASLHSVRKGEMLWRGGDDGAIQAELLNILRQRRDSCRH